MLTILVYLIRFFATCHFRNLDYTQDSLLACPTRSSPFDNICLVRASKTAFDFDTAAIWSKQGDCQGQKGVSTATISAHWYHRDTPNIRNVGGWLAAGCSTSSSPTTASLTEWPLRLWIGNEARWESWWAREIHQHLRSHCRRFVQGPHFRPSRWSRFLVQNPAAWTMWSSIQV